VSKLTECHQFYGSQLGCYSHDNMSGWNSTGKKGLIRESPMGTELIYKYIFTGQWVNDLLESMN